MFPRFYRLCQLRDRESWFNDHFAFVKRCLSQAQSQIQPEEIHNVEHSFEKINLPSTYVGKTLKVDSLRLFDESTAKKFTSLIINNLLENIDETFVVEINPGIGLLTKELLDAGVPVLHSYEKIPEFKEYLQLLVEKYQNRLDIRDHDFLKISGIDFIDRLTDSKKLSILLKGVEKKKWKSEPAIKIVGAVPKINFFHSLQFLMISRSLSNYGRIVLYVAVPPSLSMAFEDNPANAHYHKAKNIFLRMLFNFEYLGSISRKVFRPKEVRVKKKRNLKYYINDHEYLNVIKIEANADFFKNNFTRRDAIMFFYFLSVNLKRRHLRIIPALEKWVPGCGLRLIKKNMNIYTEFEELNSQELFNLFMEFKSWPEYETSPFIAFVEATLESKMMQK